MLVRQRAFLGQRSAPLLVHLWESGQCTSLLGVRRLSQLDNCSAFGANVVGAFRDVVDLNALFRA